MNLIHAFYAGIAGAAVIAAAGCAGTSKVQDYSSYVDPFIGTGGHGHTFPELLFPTA